MNIVEDKKRYCFYAKKTSEFIFGRLADSLLLKMPRFIFIDSVPPNKGLQKYPPNKGLQLI